MMSFEDYCETFKDEDLLKYEMENGLEEGEYNTEEVLSENYEEYCNTIIDNYCDDEKERRV